MLQLLPTYQVTLFWSKPNAEFRVPADKLEAFLGVLAFNNCDAFTVKRENDLDYE